MSTSQFSPKAQHLFFGFCLLVCLHMLAADAYFWRCEFSSFSEQDWQWQNCEPQLAEGALRLSTLPESRGNISQFSLALPAFKQACYLQVLMGQNEDVDAEVTVLIGSGSSAYGAPLFPGWNTFLLPEGGSSERSLTFRQKGKGKQVGPWVDYVEARLTTSIQEGLYAEAEQKQPGEMLQLDDKLRFIFKATSALGENEVDLDCYLLPNLVEFRWQDEPSLKLNDKGLRGDQQAGDLLYSATALIDSAAYNVPLSAKASLLSAVKVHGTSYYYTLPYRLDIQTEHQIPQALSEAGNIQTRKDRQLWYDYTQGENLALGKKLQLVPAPDYRLTKDENDIYDLCDGKLTKRKDDKVWFDRQSVGWYSGNGVAYLKLDLGESQKLDRLVIRCLGGTVGNFQFPRSFSAYVSQDGQSYHLARNLLKLMPGESDQSDFINSYYIEEQASQYATRMYPFQLHINAEARYVLLKIEGTSGSIFSDELALLKAEKETADFNAAYANPSETIALEGLLVHPRLGTLDIIYDVLAPQNFEINDLRSENEKTEKAVFLLDLPEGIVLAGDECPWEPLQLEAKKYRRYSLDITERNNKLSLPTVFLKIEKELSPGLSAYCMARSAGKDQFRYTLPIQTASLPQIPRFERLQVSLSWMSEGAGMNWPDFLSHWPKLGFNTVSGFPRWWNVKSHEKQRVYIEEAKAAGFKIIMNDSAFHEMMRGHKEGSEIFCDIPGKSHRMLCPSYRGKFYQKEMERVQRCVVFGIPDYVHYDIECWGSMNTSAAQCQRCQEALKKSGKTLEEFLLDCRVEQMRDLDAAVRRGAAQANIPVPIQGDYNRHPVASGEFFWRIYPQYVNLAMPSLYVAGRAIDVHKRIRDNYKMLKTKKLVPWLSTGTYGEFEPYKVEPMVLEALLNGSNGITYYSYGDFTDSPFDFYYHARALSMLRPYEDLVMDGEVLEPEGSNNKMFYSGLKLNKEMLLLVGNYHNADEKTEFVLPWSRAATILDLQSNKKLRARGNKLRFEVPKAGFRLIYIKGR